MPNYGSQLDCRFGVFALGKKLYHSTKRQFILELCG